MIILYVQLFRFNSDVKERSLPLFTFHIVVIPPEYGRNCRQKYVVYAIRQRQSTYGFCIELIIIGNIKCSVVLNVLKTRWGRVNVRSRFDICLSLGSPTYKLTMFYLHVFCYLPQVQPRPLSCCAGSLVTQAVPVIKYVFLSDRAENVPPNNRTDPVIETLCSVLNSGCKSCMCFVQFMTLLLLLLLPLVEDVSETKVCLSRRV